MGDKRIRIEKCNLHEGKNHQTNNLKNQLIQLCWLDMRLRAIEFVQQKATKSSKFQDVDLAKELKKLFDETFFPTW